MVVFVYCFIYYFFDCFYVIFSSEFNFDNEDFFFRDDFFFFDYFIVWIICKLR